VETYTNDPRNVSRDGRGNLAITAIRDGSGGWTSARIETRRSDFQPAAGGSLKIEARISLPDGGVGYWPAFWALGSPFRPGHDVLGAGEIDVLENIDNQPVVYGTLHCGTVSSGGPCHEDTGLAGPYLLPAPAGSAGFHTYAVVWSTAPAQLQWLVDGKPYWTVTPAMTGAEVWASTFGHGYFLLLNLAIGGGWPSDPDASTLTGRSMLVDYVTVSRASR
jgi:beta-glucanase (GH16 family)